ncbi:unnamed protein product [Linum trigynum]|uniref:Uncharacterized protein n=1 Tax=Linum trigynum TaxID=586398 RepID=A0AAV2CUR9_9ROSI
MLHSTTDPNYELRLLMEQFARDSERSLLRMDLCTQAYRETEEILLSLKKSVDDLERSCVQPAPDHPSSTILEEEEEEEAYKDIVEHTEVVTESSRDDHDQECPVVADHTFLHPKLSFEEAGMSEEMQEDLMKEISWQLALQSVLEEEEGEKVQKEVVEDDESEEEGVLDHLPGVIPHEEERAVEEAIGVQAGDKVEVEETCTGHELHVISPPNFEELLSKDPFAVSLCQTKATSTSVPLGGRDGGQSMLSYLVWGNETREEKKRSRGWRRYMHQVHELPSPVIPHVCDLRLHLIDENLNFKEVLGWTETKEPSSGSRRERSACWEATQPVGLHFFLYFPSVESVLFFDFRVNNSNFVRFCVVFVFRQLSPPGMHRLPVHHHSPLIW